MIAELGNIGRSIPQCLFVRDRNRSGGRVYEKKLTLSQ